MYLSEVIIQRIKNEGPISFHDFMEMALYYPGTGYYTSDKNKIGVNGDYFTSCNLTPLFGAMIGRQIEEMWRLLKEQPFTIVEFGAGTGLLCRDILDYLKNNDELYADLNYYIIEKSPVMREKEMLLLHEKVTWINSINEIHGINGCILSNELLDNFAVHQVVMEDELMEVFVDYKDEFTEVLLPARLALKNYFRELDVCLPRDFRTEVNLEATEWIREIAGALNKGFVMTIDYGYPSFELYKKYRCHGTIVCYNKHKINDDPYKNIGMQDITTHVNFSALYYWGLRSGLDCTGYTNQAHFLLSLGLKEQLIKVLNEDAKDTYMNYKKNAFIVQRLLVDMGNKLKVLIQQKGLPNYQLSGLKLSAPNETATLTKEYRDTPVVVW